MKEKDKNLLLKDLCARLYTGTIVNYDDTEGCDYPLNIKTLCNFPEEKLKCYLRPMSSMTKEEIDELERICSLYACDHDCNEEYGIVILSDYNIYSENPFEALDWLNAHHFDYRGLIEKGLALPAPKGMYKTEEL